METSINQVALQEKWAPVLDSGNAINDSHRRAVTAVVLENMEKQQAQESAQINEVAANVTGTHVDNWDPVLISLESDGIQFRSHLNPMEPNLDLI